MPQKILVTGGAGFIGSHLVEKLLQQKHQVLSLDNFDPFYNSNIKKTNITTALKNPRYTLIRGDIRDQNPLKKIFTQHHFDFIIHLAAKVGVRPSIKNPAEYLEVNVNGTLNLLEQARLHKIKNFIFASSSSVYGANAKVPFSEKDMTDHPLSPYGASKKAGELLCYTYHQLYKINIAVLRFFTVYGPRQRPDMAIHQFTGLISLFETLPLYAHGKSQRDYTYVDDIVQGIMNTIKYHRGFEIYNLGNSQTTPLITLVKLLEKYLNKKAKIKKLPPQPGDLLKTWADITKAKKLLHFDPKTNIEEGIQKFIQWYRKNKK
ncbi:MAG: GDP-mannose 4,6-dehydratase [Patescibacteria group bacterium]|nr:GDP-mannose 4,6-dehydratase [Patescibacteria group bacterium]